jgi:hypothetical protein
VLFIVNEVAETTDKDNERFLWEKAKQRFKRIAKTIPTDISKTKKEFKEIKTADKDAKRAIFSFFVKI